MVLKTCTKQVASLSMVEDHLYRWNLVVDDKSVFMVNSVRHGVWEQGESWRTTAEHSCGLTSLTRNLTWVMSGRSLLLDLPMPRVVSLRKCKIHLIFSMLWSFYLSDDLIMSSLIMLDYMLLGLCLTCICQRGCLLWPITLPLKDKILVFFFSFLITVAVFLGE